MSYIDEPRLDEPAPADDVDLYGELRIVPIEEFAATDEPGRTAVVGTADEAVVPESGDVMFYGDGGAGKTTLSVDLGCHIAAGDDWLGIPIAAPARVLIVENEGPRPLFRRKLRRKMNGWTGSPLHGRLQVLESPWGAFSFDNELHRQVLAEVIAAGTFDVVILGPVTRAGMNEAGTLQQVRDFMRLVAEVRTAAGRPVAFILVHHENKGGQVSGAWEGSGDTLFHVQGQGQGRTRLYIQKARWSTSHHALAMNLLWTDGDGFAIEERTEVTEDTIAEQLLAAALERGGLSWTKLRDLRSSDGAKLIRGKADDIATVRDQLLAAGRLVNTAAREGSFELWHADDPASPRSRPGTGQERLTFANSAEGSEPDPFPVPAFIGNGENGNGFADPRAQDETDPPSWFSSIDDAELERLAELERELEADAAGGQP